MTGTPQNKHLERIEDDQSLNGINTIDDTIRNEPGRKWFVSQAITPTVQTGFYSTSQGRIILGGTSWRDNMTPNSAFTTAAVAALTLTCATGHRYRVYYGGARNASQATSIQLSGTIGGNAITQINSTGTMTELTTIVVIGGTAQTDAVAGTYADGSIKEIWMNAGDTLTMTCSVFAAGNNTEHVFLFEDYTL